MQVTTDENKIAQQNLYLGLESSCDETAAAIVAVGSGKNPRILSSVIYDQSDLHQSFGGVVPEIAARAHAERMDFCVAESLKEASVGLCDLAGIGVTAGPGLIGWSAFRSDVRQRTVTWVGQTAYRDQPPSRSCPHSTPY